ncbi:hypothetical protein HDU98_012096 [Podochytrium sp. JEL0797]|nr:hypothetical protein HDU98_012096 [Podochytrium sp. JEL0797]
MNLIAFFALAAASALAQNSTSVAVVPSTTAPTAPTMGTCMTAAGGEITIISPLSGSVNQAGDTLVITWNSNGADPVFQAAPLGFSIVDASNPNNAQPLNQLTFVPAASPLVSAGKATVTIPTSMATSKKYALRSEYKDANLWRYCFSPTFEIDAIAAPVVTGAPTGGVAKSGAVESGYVAVLAVVGAAMVL